MKLPRNGNIASGILSTAEIFPSFVIICFRSAMKDAVGCTISAVSMSPASLSNANVKFYRKRLLE